MEYRVEHDTMGEVKVPADCLWGAQTQRSLENFPIGTETIPVPVLHAFGALKSSCAYANNKLGKLSDEKYNAIAKACERIINDELVKEFPLKVWQTGSGTQSNMNVNEVIVHAAAEGGVKLHPNDDVNMSQSSNDTFPTAMHIAATFGAQKTLIPALDKMVAELARLEEENKDIIKIGRTHLQDAVPLRFSQEISGWKAMLTESRRQIEAALVFTKQLCIGATAVGTGLNCPEGFDKLCVGRISELTGIDFVPSLNKFHGLTSKDAYVFLHGALKGLAANLMKIANDIRWMASGPRCGMGEIKIPENEPGSSIMPGKVNPTQCEAITMIAVQVMGNDATIGMAASQGNFELNVFMPVMAYNMMQSIALLRDGMISFTDRCLSGLKATEHMTENVEKSLMLVTCLSPKIGYENAAAAAKKAYKEGTSLKEAVLAMGFLNSTEYDEIVRPESMV
ncbi:MAG: class II fumarate hydratase [Lachnospiraceae bacterium]|nr:class II fumarate hydratase [Lachnospiraceae bacterium]